MIGKSLPIICMGAGLKSTSHTNDRQIFGILFLKNQTCLEDEIWFVGVLWHSRSVEIFLTWNSERKAAI